MPTKKVRSMPTKKARSMPTKKARSMPTKKAQIYREKRGGWIEFDIKINKAGERVYYARRRSWKRRGGVWVKSSPKRVKSIKPMKEKDYQNYVAKRNQAKRVREIRNA
ncbi:MAG: hypothetical protein CUN56_00035 [Phototrophicales bacterium]|nr:MAG: hypothetical protein CUN56_00035 [Phototrophicales bacterium]